MRAFPRSILHPGLIPRCQELPPLHLSEHRNLKNHAFGTGNQAFKQPVEVLEKLQETFAVIQIRGVFQNSSNISFVFNQRNRQIELRPSRLYLFSSDLQIGDGKALSNVLENQHYLEEGFMT